MDTALIWPELDYSKVRASVAAWPARPMEHLGEAPRPVEGAFSELRTGRWTWGGETLEVGETIKWRGYSRTFEYRLHAWEPLLRLIVSYEQSGHETPYAVAKRFAFDWLRSVQTPLLKTKSKAPPADDMAWYDMAVAMRTYRLAWLVQAIAGDEEVSDAAFQSALRALYFHLHLLSDDAHFSGHSNHGLYQALGQYAAALRFRELPGIQPYLDQGLQRFYAVLQNQISVAGVHLEHSPGYHQMILGSLLGARRSGLFDGIDLPPDLSAMQAALSWMIAPDNTLAPIGDTDPVLAGAELGAPAQLDDEGLAWQCSHGGCGKPPAMGAKAYRMEGYAFGRLLGPGENDPRRAAWLAQHCGFHSRTHKHADHGAFVWHDRGRAILIDPGKYDYGPRTEKGSPQAKAGNWYSDPARIYVESTRAHNCVEIDALDYPRAGVTPFGSGLLHCAMHGQTLVTESEFRHRTSIRHRRLLVMAPGDYLLVLDWLADATGQAHDYRQMFSLAPNWRPRLAPDGYDLADALAPSQDMVARSLLPDIEIDPILEGETDPMEGWYSPGPRKITPAPRLGFASSRGANALFCTVFAFGSVFSAAEPLISSTFTSGKLNWTLDGRSYRVEFVRRAKEAIALTALRL